MHSATVFFALAALASASAVAVGHGGVVGITADVYSRPAYTYSYAVSDKLTGDQKSATETRDGDVTKGSYSLVQPDGILRTVNYISTPLGGFQAQVLNNGVAVHPARAILAAAPVAIAAPALGWGAGPVVNTAYGLNGLNGLGWGR